MAKRVAALFSVANPIPVKVLMHENGDIDSPALQLPLTHFELTDTQAVIDANDAVESWYREQTSVAAVGTATRQHAQSA